MYIFLNNLLHNLYLNTREIILLIEAESVVVPQQLQPSLHYNNTISTQSLKSNIKEITDFFNLEIDCPATIVNCASLREEYLQEINKATLIYGTCPDCVINNIKQQFIKKIFS